MKTEIRIISFVIKDITNKKVSRRRIKNNLRYFNDGTIDVKHSIRTIVQDEKGYDIDYFYGEHFNKMRTMYYERIQKACRCLGIEPYHLFKVY